MFVSSKARDQRQFSFAAGTSALDSLNAFSKNLTLYTRWRKCPALVIPKNRKNPMIKIIRFVLLMLFSKSIMSVNNFATASSETEIIAAIRTKPRRTNLSLLVVNKVLTAYNNSLTTIRIC
jgi:hypothetical protein